MLSRNDGSIESLSALKRFKLVGLMNSLPEAEFNQVVLALNPTPGLVAPRGASKGDRTFDLFEWIQSSNGPGLEVLIKILQEIPNSNLEELLSNTSYRYKVTLDVDPERIDINQLKQVINGLGSMVGDDSIRIIGVDKGSLTIYFTGDPDKLQRLPELFDSGQLIHILDGSITSLERVDTETVRPHEEHSRLTISLPTLMLNTLKEKARTKGVSVSSLVHDSIMLNAYLQNVLDNGGDILLQDKNGTISRLESQE